MRSARMLLAAGRTSVRHLSAISLCAVMVPGLVYGTEGEERWRFSEHEGRISLFVAATGQGTDHFGPLSFHCMRASGSIDVDGDMDEQEREAFADLIRSNGYPRIDLVPPDASWSSVEISHLDMGGWHYKFVISTDAKAFSDFAKTGVFQFKVGEFVLRSEFDVGLENAVQSQALCRKPSSR